jgi:hypothetical protein
VKGEYYRKLKINSELIMGNIFSIFFVVQSKLIHKGKYGKRMYFSEQINVDLLHFSNFLTSWLQQAADSQHSTA